MDRRRQRLRQAETAEFLRKADAEKAQLCVSSEGLDCLRQNAHPGVGKLRFLAVGQFVVREKAFSGDPFRQIKHR